jgi:hypothetical protein
MILLHYSNSKIPNPKVFCCLVSGIKLLKWFEMYHNLWMENLSYRKLLTEGEVDPNLGCLGCMRGSNSFALCAMTPLVAKFWN